MILQALKEYYDRKAADPDGGMASEGWIQGGIDFIIELDLDGRYLGIECLQEQSGKNYIPKAMQVPNIGKQSLKHTNSGRDANLLWDNASFVFGMGEKGDARLSSMIEAIDHWLPDCSDPDVKSVRAFLSSGLRDRAAFASALGDAVYGEAISTGQPKITFRIKGSQNRSILDSRILSSALSSSSGRTEGPIGVCLVTGENNVAIEQTHTVIKGVWGAQTSGAYIVGFNKESFLSYAKEQAANAPISKKTASEYVKALNYLLSSEQRMQVGDASTVFWSAQRTDFESDFASFFQEPAKDDPGAGTKKVKNLFESVSNGAYLDDKGTEKFYILGLAPNAARISVRFWQSGTVAEFSETIRRHFEDLAIIKPPNEPEYYSLWRLLVNIAIQDKSENIPPNVAGDFMRSILNGTPYPATLLQAALRRIHSDAKERVKPVRAALVKAYLNRYLRAHPDNVQKEIQMALDPEQPSTGYQLGRLFAALEKIQEEANPGLNATIRERYYGSACSSPVSVFGTLMRLKNHHLAKLNNKGRAVNFERIVGQIVGRFDDFPAHLDLHEQGRFAIGYYHQRQVFFTKKD
ncbi:MAG TPA: type I-C CRISPR-associated protein Cas8c/Csd1 [Spirochaetales bacterium]|nr:type I-C CRISPR-associated protein Cas8c/Csd1 [Spirochaetales bacterium]HRY53178.1 type I-C CRISPR-associated protein Cas8c/Csd1 [Spirochaetia bacterium]HRZ63281.1 type I-C CRISPR-associated protein Cas8c/Csd1 [Spirochaetia bacterium]